MSGNHALMSVIIDAGLKCFAALLQPEIVQFAQITIAVFALHKCGDFLNLPFERCAGSVRDGDVGVPPGQEAKGDGACNPAQNGAARHEAEEHQHAAIPFKVRGFEQFDPGEPGPDPQCRAAQRTQEKAEQNQQCDLHSAQLAPNFPRVAQCWVGIAGQKVHVVRTDL